MEEEQSEKKDKKLFFKHGAQIQLSPKRGRGEKSDMSILAKLSKSMKSRMSMFEIIDFEKDQAIKIEGIEKEINDPTVFEKSETEYSFWTTKITPDEDVRRTVLKNTLRGLLTHIAFLIIVTIHCTRLTGYDNYGATEVIRRSLTQTTFPTHSGLHLIFEEISTLSDIWYFLEGLTPEFFYENLQYNRYYPIKPKISPIFMTIWLLGAPRIRQVKTRNNSCKIFSKAAHLFETCYALYSEDTEDRVPFGLEEGTAWTWNSQEETKNLPTGGHLETFGGGGYYLDFPNDKEKMLEAIKHLKNNEWIDRGTRVVFLHFSLYNVNINKMSSCKIIFQTLPCGGVFPSIKIHTFVAAKRFSTMVFLSTVEYLLLICTAYYCFETVLNIRKNKCNYFKEFWNYVDIIIILLPMSIVPFLLTECHNLLMTLEEYGNDKQKYLSLENISEQEIFHTRIAAMLIFFAYFKLFKYININIKFKEQITTITECAVDLIAYFVVFFIIVLCYADVGFVIFGREVFEYRTIFNSLFSMMTVILGAFNYKAFEQINQKLTTCFFATYIFLVFFVLMSMFTAIINSSYGNVKTERSVAPEEISPITYIKEIFAEVKRFCVRDSNKSEGKKPMKLYQKLWSLFTDQNFTHVEAHMFFTRFNALKEGNVDIDMNDLKARLDKATEMDLLIKTSEEKNDSNIDQKVSGEEYNERILEMELVEQSIDALATKIDWLAEKLKQMEAERQFKNKLQNSAQNRF